ATSRFENLGEVTNKGWEALLTGQVMQRDNFGWDMAINASSNSNKLVSMGDVPEMRGATVHERPGYPLHGYWSVGLLDYADANNNGIIELSEITTSDTAVYHGTNMPKLEVALTNGFEFWNRRLRLSGMLDYKGGHIVYNNS